LKQLADAAMAGDILHAESALAELYGALNSKPVIVRAGLASNILRRIDDWIETKLDQTLRPDELAIQANPSEFHLHRLFRRSRGVAPHAWVIERRVDRARILLQSDRPIAEIAVACGFSSQSHLTRVFRQQTGRTPANYRYASHR